MLLEIMKHAARPPLFARGNCMFWTDPHTAKYLLEAHLDPDWDAASRRPAAIERTVSFVVEQLGGKTNARILDLGCGPGLYAQRLSRLGHQVTGMDLSEGSLDYARAQAESENLPIEFVRQNYLELDYVEAFDLVMLIYCDVGALTATEQEHLFGVVRRALKPGGVFVFDVYSLDSLAGVKESRDWEVREEGFWANEPHLALSETFVYAEAGVKLDQTIVAKASGRIDVHRIYSQYYSEEQLQSLLARHGFKSITTQTGLIEEVEIPGEHIIFVTAVR